MRLTTLCCILLSPCPSWPQESATVRVPSFLTPAEDTVRPFVRQARGKAFHIRAPSSLIDSGQPAVPPPVMIVDFAHEPELPIDTADTVLAGEIMNVQPFLTPDGKGIYSEYELKVLETVKAKAPLIASSGAMLTLLRQGGAGRLPDGRVLRRRIHDDVTPEMGKKYLFFLTCREPLEAFYHGQFWLIEKDVMSPLFPDDTSLRREGRSLSSGKMLPEVLAVPRSMARHIDKPSPYPLP